MRQMRHAISLCLALALSACGNAPDEPPPPRIVETIRVAPAALDASDRFPATLRADDRGRLGFETGGQIARVNVDVGDRFGRGQLLATLTARQQQLGVESSEAQVSQARAALQEAELDYERKSDLSGTGAVADAEIDAARRRRDEARAQVRALDAQRGQASDRLSDTRLYAPYTGVVTARLAEPSEVVGAGEAVLEVSGLAAGLEAVITVPASQRGAFQIGRSFLFAVDAEAPRAAIVRQINASASATGLFEIILHVPNARESGLAEGVQGEILLQSPQETGIVLPLSAIRMRDEARATVMVFDPQSKQVKPRGVRLGQVGDGGVIIESGLRNGEIVVSKGARLLRANEVVQAAGEGPRRYSQ